MHTAGIASVHMAAAGAGLLQSRHIASGHTTGIIK